MISFLSCERSDELLIHLTGLQLKKSKKQRRQGYAIKNGILFID